MTRRFGYYLKVVIVAHLALLGLLVLISGWRRFFRPKPPTVMPVEFMVAVPASADAVTPEILPMPEPEPAPQPEPAPPKPPRKKIERSTRRITRPVDRPPAEKTLSREEIQELLERGIKPGNETILPDKDGLCLDRVRRVFYAAWEQPSREEAGDTVVRASVSFGDDGAIVARRLVGSSGNALLDASVMRALNAVQRVTGLTADFIKRHRTVVIAFKVE